MVHGQPTWSFMYRHLIRGLSPHHRCIAADHIEFGLSDSHMRIVTWNDGFEFGVREVVFGSLARFGERTAIVHAQ